MIKKVGRVAVSEARATSFDDGESGLANCCGKGLCAGGTGDVAGSGDLCRKQFRVNTLDESRLLETKEHIPRKCWWMIAVDGVVIGDPHIGRCRSCAIEVNAAIEFEQYILC